MSDEFYAGAKKLTTSASPWVKFGKPGDRIKGILKSVNEREDEYLGVKRKQKVYEIEAIAGSFHNIKDKKPEKEATEVVAGETYQVGGKTMLDRALESVKIGSTIIIEYTKDFTTKSGNDAKFLEVSLVSEPETTETTAF